MLPFIFKRIGDNEMKDIEKKILYKDMEYTVVFNLNVMESIQSEYGSLDEWVEMIDGTENAKKKYKEKHGSLDGFDDSDEKDGEPNLKALIDGYYIMLNEGIEISNDEKGTSIKPLTHKQVGRILTEIGFENAQKKLGVLMSESTESNEKNE